MEDIFFIVISKPATSFSNAIIWNWEISVSLAWWWTHWTKHRRLLAPHFTWAQKRCDTMDTTWNLISGRSHAISRHVAHDTFQVIGMCFVWVKRLQACLRTIEYRSNDGRYSAWSCTGSTRTIPQSNTNALSTVNQSHDHVRENLVSRMFAECFHEILISEWQQPSCWMNSKKYFLWTDRMLDEYLRSPRLNSSLTMDKN